MAARRDLPIFPLPIVALPSEIVPLHIFEERYKLMVARCLDQGLEFVIVYEDASGRQATGCRCEITTVLSRFDDGRLNLLATGTGACRIVAPSTAEPYLSATIEELDDEDEPIASDLERRVHAAYAALAVTAGAAVPDPLELAAISAYGLAAGVGLGSADKQRLLELRSERARWALLLDLLEAARASLRAAARRSAGGPNDGSPPPER